jgi:renalase
MRTAKSIAVIGAGMAGLTCARHLHAAGQLVRVFEKSRGIGGRLATRRAGEARFDHGAQHFTARDPEFLRDIAAASRIGACAAWHAQIAPELARGFAIRAVDEPWFVGSPGMKDLLRNFAAELYVSYLTKVETLKREGSGWNLIANDGENIGKFDYVLITAPAPQTAALLPPGSALRFAVEQIVLLPCWALMLEYADNLPLATDAGQPDDDVLAWLSYDQQTGSPKRRASLGLACDIGLERRPVARDARNGHRRIAYSACDIVQLTIASTTPRHCASVALCPRR